MMKKQCDYRYEPPAELSGTPHIDIDRPEPERCPHPVADADAGRCLFHLLDEEYPASEATEAVRDALVDETRPPVFAGAYFPGLELSKTTLSTPDGRPIDLRGATIDGPLNLSEATVEVPLLLDGAILKGSWEATDATFNAPVSFAGATFDGGLHWADATVDGGISGNDCNFGFVDWRGLTVEGSLVIERSSFRSTLQCPRASITGDYLATETSYDWHTDLTALSVRGDMELANAAVDGWVDATATSVGGDLRLRKSEVGDAIDLSHTTIGGDLLAGGCTFGDEANFRGVLLGGSRFELTDTSVKGNADFNSLVLSGTFDAADSQFDDEVWFVHADLNGKTDLQGSKFHGQTHLRDAHFGGDLLLTGVETTDQTWLAGSTIDGRFDCTDATLGYFQFSATANGTVDFSRTAFTDKAVFTNSAFEHDVCFDDASFAAAPAFDRARFADTVSFKETEFLVVPSFDETRFAEPPELALAQFPTEVEIDSDDHSREWQTVLAHPDTLERTGLTVPLTDLQGDIAVPASLSSLLDADFSRTKAVMLALGKLNKGEWRNLLEEPLQTARTAVAQLDNELQTTLVFGVELNERRTPGDGFLEGITLAGVYERTDTAIRFGHLSSTLDGVDALIAVPASDKAFTAGVTVATCAEGREAILRHARLHLLVLGNKGELGPISELLSPVLVGQAQVTSSPP